MINILNYKRILKNKKQEQKLLGRKKLNFF
jgi:hypothetical protein